MTATNSRRVEARAFVTPQPTIRLILPKDLKSEKGIAFKLNYLRKLWRRGEFPVPVKLTPNGHHIAFVEHEIDAWLDEKASSARLVVSTQSGFATDHL